MKCDLKNWEQLNAIFFNLFARKKGQAAVFIIIAIVIVVGAVVYFLTRGNVGSDNVPAELAPVYEYYQSCIEDETRAAIQVTGAGGGWISEGDYVPGSEYAPFSSHLNFLGTPVRYWYYVAGNGIVREQVPSENEMEGQMEGFVRDNLERCDFGEFFARGYDIELGEREVKIDVQEDNVVVEVSSAMSVRSGEISATKTLHRLEMDSKLGKFYNEAKEIYTKQKEEAFLERYAVDVLYLYAPVDGVDIQCGPKVWSTENVFSGVKEALETNFAAIKFDGDYYELKNKDSEYFIVDESVNEAVNVLYSRSWPMKIEVYGEGVDDQIMIAEPVGTQEGMGAMGFCYVPYHFVYDLSFPTMIQIYDGNELFQFPVVVVIDNNVAREAQISDEFPAEEEEFDLCQYKQQSIEVNVFDVNLNRVDANLSYECFDQRCRLGETRRGNFRGSAPACVNGYLSVSAGGYADKKQLFSTNNERYADIVLEREHDVEIDLKVAGKELRGNAIVTFVAEDGRSRAVSLPESNKIKLSEGSYEVKAYVFGNSSVTIPASTKLECVDVPKGGLLGFFGSTEEKCFEIKTQETKIDYALIGGGVTSEYLLESNLRKGKIEVRVEELPRPDSLDDLANNFELFETRRIYFNYAS